MGTVEMTEIAGNFDLVDNPLWDQLVARAAAIRAAG
jgi:hypothetical protein